MHNLDVANWFLGGVPVSAVGSAGGRCRIPGESSEIFDHHAVVYEYPGGIVVNSQCRQFPGVNNVSEVFHGTKGTLMAGRIVDRKGNIVWQHRGRRDADPYQVEHNRLHAAIRGHAAEQRLLRRHQHLHRRAGPLRHLYRQGVEVRRGDQAEPPHHARLARLEHHPADRPRPRRQLPAADAGRLLDRLMHVTVVEQNRKPGVAATPGFMDSTSPLTASLPHRPVGRGRGSESIRNPGYLSPFGAEEGDLREGLLLAPPGVGRSSSAR